MTLADVLSGARHVLLDFDGPVCAVYGGSSDRAVADHLRALLADDGPKLPADIRVTSDPLVVLRYCAGLGAHTLRLVESEFVAEEVRAVATATETPGARTAIEALTTAGRTVTIVSNNSARAVNAYIDRQGLGGLIAGVIGRTLCDPESMKPRPHLLLEAVAARGTSAADCVMIGDSVSDVVAARAAGVSSIAYANRPDKRRKLADASPDFVVDSMDEIAVSAGRARF